MYKQWSIAWAGQPIVVKAWWNSLRAREELWIDGRLVDRSRSSFWVWDMQFAQECLAAPVDINGCNHGLAVVIFRASGRAYCHILVDGELVGGDENFLLPLRNPARWQKIRQRGIGHFLLGRSLLMGLMFALVPVVYAVLGYCNSLVLLVQWSLGGFVTGLVSGIVIGCVVWKSSETIHVSSLANRAKLEALE
jgi:hypothetical protein